MTTTSFPSFTRTRPPQGFISSYPPRLRNYANSLLTPVVQPPTQQLNTRITKRGTTSINYAEDFDDDDFEDSEGPSRRPTGLRSIRKEDLPVNKEHQQSQLGKQVHAPVDVQGVWRGWMGISRSQLSQKQLKLQCNLPLNLIPIRIDLDVQPFRPQSAFPWPPDARERGLDDTNPVYRPGEVTPVYRIKDFFLWNLHEATVTPDHFAKLFGDELDFPEERKGLIVTEVTRQIREQLEQYAGIAMHPLFNTAPHSADNNTSATKRDLQKKPSSPQTNGNVRPTSQGKTPLPNDTSLNTPAQSATPVPSAPSVQATAIPIPPTDATNQAPDDDVDPIHNPDDTYRCIIHLSVNLQNRLYTDAFEWSLLHPPGLAELFARQTCADLGLSGEWASAISHAIYESVLRIRKEVCDNGGMVLGAEHFSNDAAHGDDAGWRYDSEGRVGEKWEPRLEMLSKEEIEKREGDRERQLRRSRRETARYSSTTNVASTHAPQHDFFSTPMDDPERPLGRGERSKKKRRFRSLSPSGRDTPDGAIPSGYGGGAALNEEQRKQWRCIHCGLWGHAAWAVRDGPKRQRMTHAPSVTGLESNADESKKTLCHNCGLIYERDKKLPPHAQGLFHTSWNQMYPTPQHAHQASLPPAQAQSMLAASRR